MIQAIDDDQERQAGIASQAHYAQQHQQSNSVNIMDQPQPAPAANPNELEMMHQRSGNPFAQGTLPPSSAWQ